MNEHRSANRAGPTYPPPQPHGLTPVLERNIHALQDRRRGRRRSIRPGAARRCDHPFTGSMLFVYLHLAVFGFWIIANLGWIPGVPKGTNPSWCLP